MSSSKSARWPPRRAARASSARCSASRAATTWKFRKLSPTSRSTRAVRPASARPGTAGGGELARRAACASRHRRSAARVALGRGRYSGSTLLSTSAPRWKSRVVERLAEELGLAHRRASSVVTTSERRAPVVQQPLDGLGPLDEPVVHRLEEQEELGDVLQELRCRGCGRPPGRRAWIATLSTARRGAADAVRQREPQQAADEEVGHPLGRLEEVDGVPGRRRVDDDQVVAPDRVDLVEPLHGDVVVALHEAAGDVLVQRVGEDGVAVASSGACAQHQVVPRLLGVEHRGPQLAAGLDAGRRRTPRAAPASRRCRTPRARGRWPSRLAGSTVSTSTLPPSCAAAATAAAAAAVVLPDAARAAADHDLLGGEQRLERGPTLAAQAHRPELLAERLGDHAGDPQPVVAHEQVRHVEQREVDRARAAGRGATTRVAAQRHRQPGARRAPRSAPDPTARGSRTAAARRARAAPRTPPRRRA